MQPVNFRVRDVFLVVLLAALAACSLRNREGLDLSCDQLQGGAVNACGDGVITACVAGSVVYKVCDDADACSADWQSPGRYGCSAEEAAAFKPSPTGTGGSNGGGSGSSGTSGTTSKAGSSGTAGAAPYRACGTDFTKPACGMCLGSSKCCQPLTACAGEPACTSCLRRTGDQTPCAPDVVPTYDDVLTCLASTCTEECK